MVLSAINVIPPCLQGTGNGLQARLVRMKDAVVRLGLMHHLTKSEELLSQTLTNTEKFLKQLSAVSTKEMLGYNVVSSKSFAAIIQIGVPVVESGLTN